MIIKIMDTENDVQGGFAETLLIIKSPTIGD